MKKQTFADKLKSYAKKPRSLFLFIIVWLAAIATAAVLVILVGYILIKGVPNLSLKLFAPVYTSENVSLFPALVNTIVMTMLSLLIAVPLGVSAAVYLTEYSKRGGRIGKIVAMAAETLSGIPSIIYGLFGMLFFVTALGWGYSLLSGACTLAIMILPLMIRTTQEALISVPDSFREGSFGLGAGMLRTVVRIVLPAATPGILSGIILSIGRVVGESAALIFTAGTVAAIPNSLMSSGRTLSVHMYALSNEGLHVGEAYATAVVLLVIVIAINWLSSTLAKRMTKS